MYYGNLRITDKNGLTTTVEYAYADDGKVLVGKDGNEVSCIEKTKLADYTEVDFVPPEEATAEDYENALADLGVRV